MPDRRPVRGVRPLRPRQGAPAAPVALDPSERQQALVQMYAWYKDWSNTAHAVIKKRAHLITLGLAKRRMAKKSEEDKK